MAELITALTLIFLTAAVMLFVLDRLSHPMIPAYILAGIVVGAFIEGTLLMDLAQLGIAFLVFIFGMKLEPGRLHEVAEDAVLVALFQIVFVALLVYVIASMFGIGTLNAAYLSIAAALSSSLVGLELIQNEISLDLLHGRLAESINLVQDLVGIFLILAVTASPFVWSEIVVTVMMGTALLCVALIIRRYIAPSIARLADGSRELMMLTGMTALVGFLYLAQILQLSILVGAFAAGMSLAKFPYNLELLDSMESLKDFFAAIFFVVLGALLTFPGPETIAVAGAMVFITSFLKPALTVIALIWRGYDSRTSYLTSMGIDHVSEFALIAAIQAFIAQAIYQPIFEGIIIAATVTMILSSYTTRYAEPIYTYFVQTGWIQTNYSKLNERSDVSGDLENHIILAGYGVQGKMIAENLRRRGKTFIIVENDPEQITEARQHEEHYVFGNVMSDYPWDRANADDAALIISTIPDRKASHEILSLETGADIILRTNSLADAETFLENGARYVAIPELMASDQLVRHIDHVLSEDGYIEELRERNQNELQSYFYSSEPYDDNA